MNTLGDRIRILRSGRALTQQAVAEALGVSRSAVAMWEKDEREPDLERSRSWRNCWTCR